MPFSVYIICNAQGMSGHFFIFFSAAPELHIASVSRVVDQKSHDALVDLVQKTSILTLSNALHDIDTKLAWNLTLAFKPAENFLIYAQYTNPQSLSLTRDALEGRSLTVTADLSF